MSLISIQNVSVHKTQADGKPHLILDKVNCTVAAGEILAIIGPNGAGKSTLLKAVSGDLNYQGSVVIDGLSDNLVERARQLSVLPQQSQLNFPYLVSEVVQLARIPHRSGRQRDEQIIDLALAMMDISFLKNRLYTELSGGERQRVQVARVLAQIWDQADARQGTRVLLLDEPANALDLGHQRDLMRAVRTFAKQGVAIIMVLHDINLAARYADKMLALLCSQQVAFGSVNDVITTDNINKLFAIDAEVMPHPATGLPMVMGF